MNIVTDSAGKCTAYSCASCCAMRSAPRHEAAHAVLTMRRACTNLLSAMLTTSFSLKSEVSVALQCFPRQFAWRTAWQARHGSTHSRLAQFLRSARGMRKRAGGRAPPDCVGWTRSGSQPSCGRKTSPCQSPCAGKRSQSGAAKGAGHAAPLFRRVVGRQRRDRGRERQATRIEARDLPQLRHTATDRGHDRINPLTLWRVTLFGAAPSPAAIEHSREGFAARQMSSTLTCLRPGSSPSTGCRTCRRTCQIPWPRTSC